MNAAVVHFGYINKISVQATMDLELNFTFFFQNLCA